MFFFSFTEEKHPGQKKELDTWLEGWHKKDVLPMGIVELHVSYDIFELDKAYNLVVYFHCIVLEDDILKYKTI